MKSVEAVRNRLDALASEALEHVIEKVEKTDDVKVTDVQVEVASHAPGEPLLDVSVTVERA